MNTMVQSYVNTLDKYSADALRAHLQWLEYRCLECAFSLDYIYKR